MAGDGRPATPRPPLTDLVTAPGRRTEFEAAGWWDSNTLSGRVLAHAASHPDALAVVDASTRVTWARLRDEAAGLAVWMTEAGVAAGQVVSIQLPNRYEFVAAAVAAQSIGAVVNPLLPDYRAKELTNVFLTAGPALVFTPGEHRGFDHRELIAQVSAATGTRPLHVVVGDHAGPESFAYEMVVGCGGNLRAGRAAEVSELIFTSGTEARPKAIMHTEQTANFSVRVARSDLGVDDGDVVWMPSPLGHSTGFNYGMRFAAYHGLPLVLQDSWDPQTAAELIETEGCSYTLAATPFLKDLVDTVPALGADVSTMRFFGCGGAAVPPGLVDAASTLGIRVLRLYGSTEVLVATWNRPSSPPECHRHTDGRPLSQVEVEVLDADGRPVANGVEGELYVRGPNTSVGYYDDARRTRATFGPGGWVRSGDVVSLDDRGYVTVVGRRKEILIRGGLNIAPREIEEMLLGFDEVDRAAVIGLPDDRLGERMCACVVLAGGAALDLGQVVQRLRAAGLATYKLPERLEICDSLPMTASGKVQKHVLVQRFAP